MRQNMICIIKAEHLAAIAHKAERIVLVITNIYYASQLQNAQKFFYRRFVTLVEQIKSSHNIGSLCLAVHVPDIYGIAPSLSDSIGIHRYHSFIIVDNISQ